MSAIQEFSGSNVKYRKKENSYRKSSSRSDRDIAEISWQRYRARETDGPGRKLKLRITSLSATTFRDERTKIYEPCEPTSSWGPRVFRAERNAAHAIIGIWSAIVPSSLWSKEMVTSGYVAFHTNTIMIGPVRRPPIDPTGVTFTSYRGRIERSNVRVRGKIWIQRGYFSESSSKWISLANHGRSDRLIVPTVSHIAWELPISDSQFQVLIGRSWV